MRHAELRLKAQVDSAGGYRGRSESLLRSLQPARQLYAVAKAVLTDIWKMRRTEAKTARLTIETQPAETGKQIESLLDRIMDASSPSVIRAYEKRIEELQRQKIRLVEQADAAVPPQGRLSELIEPALAFLASPWNI